jgi:hypothetical protein
MATETNGEKKGAMDRKVLIAGVLALAALWWEPAGELVANLQGGSMPTNVEERFDTLEKNQLAVLNVLSAVHRVNFTVKGDGTIEILPPMRPATAPRERVEQPATPVPMDEPIAQDE